MFLWKFGDKKRIEVGFSVVDIFNDTSKLQQQKQENKILLQQLFILTDFNCSFDIFNMTESFFNF